MFKLTKGVLFAAVLLLIVPLAIADDGYAALGAGGLIFSKTHAISMEKEVLEISPNRVQVSYVFRNLTSKDVAATVAFPIPPIKCGVFDRSDYPDHFKTVVNGVVIKPKIEKRAFIRKDVVFRQSFQHKYQAGEEITGFLRDHKIPVDCRLATPVPPDYDKPSPAYSKAATLGLADPSDPSTDPFSINYETHIKYYWQQKFPAHSVVHISHAYNPAYGLSHDVLDKEYYPSYYQHFDQYQKFFADQPGMRDFVTNGHGGGYRIIDFILKSARSWAGPIGEFKLVLKKPPCFVVSSLAGPLRMADGNIVIERKNFTPKNNIKIFYTSHDRHSICADGPV